MSKAAYFICGTPRTGSTLLCSLLKSSTVAGVPESYFRSQDKEEWAREWKLPAGYSFRDFLDATITAGTTENNIFGVRIMWGTMDELVDNLSTIYSYKNDLDLLTQAFGNCHFIYIKRDDLIAQAVSLLRAVQTDVWHITGYQNALPQESHYDFNQIQKYVDEAQEHNEAWLKWFRENDITPHEIIYEDLSNDPIGETLKVLDFLNLKLPKGIELSANNKRMADDISQNWIERYKKEAI